MELGTREVWPYGDWKLKIRGNITVKFLPGIQTKGMTMEDKASIIISIEGKRSKDGTLSPYKRGPVLIAIQTGATIIPVFMKGTREVWPYGDWKLKIHGNITVKFLPGIQTKGMTMEDRFRITQQLRDLAETELAKLSPKHKY